uniref:Uncharacterized protein n=2 Tax=unclassified Candidatus Kentrum TaxID=2643149 RepID=A0A451AX77_9GAMM|nr:MAG: hypothetical protein BECKLPF1236A_GA0070988_101711 [Candidatus Kentron sp. LPFa]VFK62901.1 MAG: hypothetical protein BECKUNK1418G_GA0071005_10288 [Candidatus Kentron sp. UNK]VFK70656.1 MAG: hypothetical protein BECKUNK1418H_GA0071006_10358 [Candidatus Kentron sp. UNK]
MEEGKHRWDLAVYPNILFPAIAFPSAILAFGNLVFLEHGAPTGQMQGTDKRKRIHHL